MTDARSRPVVVVPFDPRWPVTFEALRAVYARVLGGLAVAIEHVGSTAVPGLTAKPIIDIDVVIRSRDALPEVVSRLAAVGYGHQGDLGVAGREAFSGDGADDVPRDGTGRRWPEHHLYVCAADCPELQRHLLFRDWLRRHPGRAAEYGALKERLTRVHRDDRDAYTLAKTHFVEAVLAEAERATTGRVILVGGAPLSGKTAAARLIGQRWGMPVISTDHLGEAARAVTSPESHADLHACTRVDYREYYTASLPERLLADALRAHRALWPAIEAVIRRHLEWAGPAVIEGWALLPHLVATIESPGLCSVWIEAPEATMRSRLQAESDFVRGAADPSLLVERFVSRSVSMNGWLREQASACGLPHVALSGLESPDDVAARCLQAMGLGVQCGA